MVDPQDTVLLGTITTSGAMTGVTTGTSNGVSVQNHNFFTFAAIGIGAISSGVITFEEAYIPPGTSTYTGTWSALPQGTVTCTAIANSAQQVVHYQATAMMTIRARISTTVVGGTVLVVLRAQ